MATRAERTLEKHGKNVVSIKEKIKAYEEQLRQEEEREEQAKSFALIELARTMNLSYNDLKNAVNIARTQTIIPVPEIPDNAGVIPEIPDISDNAEVVPLETTDPAEDETAVYSRKLKEKSKNDEEIS